MIPEGRISPRDSGIWSDEHAEAFGRITPFIGEQGAVPAIQLAHAGRKASTEKPWRGGGPVAVEEGGWQPLAPSPVAFAEGGHTPAELDEAGIEKVVEDFADAARRAIRLRSRRKSGSGQASPPERSG